MNEYLLESKRKDLENEIDQLRFNYSENEKKNFLRQINQNSLPKTTKVYMAIMNRLINGSESRYNKNWYEFSERMVDSSFVKMESKSIITLQTYLSIIKKYLLVTTPQTDNMKTGYHYTMSLTKDDLVKYINNIGEEYRYITPEEFDQLIEESKVASMAKCIFILIRLGFKGIKYQDICELRTDDINFDTGEITKDGEVVLVIPEKYLDIFRDAIKSSQYPKVDENGTLIEMSKMNMSTEYFLKRRIGKSTDSEVPPDSALVSVTLTDLYNSLKNPYVNATSLYVSMECYKLLEMCNMQMPTNQDLKEFRKTTGSKLSFVTMNSACKVLLNKIKKDTP